MFRKIKKVSVHSLLINENTTATPTIANYVVSALDIISTFVGLHNVDGKRPRRRNRVNTANNSKYIRRHLTQSALFAHRLAIA